MGCQVGALPEQEASLRALGGLNPLIFTCLGAFDPVKCPPL
jgi:hypothetical protein